MFKTDRSTVLLQGDKRVLALLSGFTKGQERKVKQIWGRSLKRAMRKEVREFVLSSDLSRFENNPTVRLRKAREFKKLVSTRVVFEGVLLFDNETKLSVNARDRSLPGDRATSRQAARLRELGVTQGGRPRKNGALPRQRRLSKREITGKWSRKKAGLAIRLIEQNKLGAPRGGVNRGTERRRGRIMPVVWRRRKEHILEHANLRKPILAVRRISRTRARKVL